MTDTSQGGAVPAPATAPAPAAPADTGGDSVPRAVYEKEVADRIRERNLYKSVNDRVRGLAADELDSVLDLADRVAARDWEAVQDWSLGTVEQIAKANGKSVADVIAARQGATPMGQAAAPAVTAPAEQGQQPAPLTAEQVMEIAERQAQKQYQLQQEIAQLDGIMRDNGFDSRTPVGQTIIRMARQNGIRDQREALTKAITDYREDAARYASQAAQAAATAAGQVPAPAPNGAPAPVAPVAGLTPAERAKARIESWKSGG